MWPKTFEKALVQCQRTRKRRRHGLTVPFLAAHVCEMGRPLRQARRAKEEDGGEGEEGQEGRGEEDGGGG